ncbi:Peptidase M60, enhancin and enhancin-like [Leuconostocaceae bacterium R-53105]|nr:Peptidase M60, enhancin and enhancin-like [Leuconostocaceae bacterium R-53105]
MSSSTSVVLSGSVSQSTALSESTSTSATKSTSDSTSTSTASSLVKSTSESDSNVLSESTSNSATKSASDSQSLVDQSVSNSISTSTANSLTQSTSESASAVVSQSTSLSVVQSASLIQSASVSTAKSASTSASVVFSTSTSVSGQMSATNSTSDSQSTVGSQSISLIISTSHSQSNTLSQSISTSTTASQSASESEKNKIKQQDIFSIVNPTWVTDAGISKGQDHDRQDLGIILGKGNSIRIRQVDPNFKNKLTLRLLGDDSGVEQQASIGSDWVTITANDNFVPFIETPLGGNGAKIEYEIVSPSNQKPLPIYQHGQDSAAFFQTWQQNQAEYGLIKSKSFQMMVPMVNYDLLKKSAGFDSLDSLIDYYEGIFTKYNEIAGFDNSSAVNRNSQNRYFIKADASGVGFAYYGPRWTAQHAKFIDMYLHGPAEKTWAGDVAHWGTLHEIAHGYQTGFDDQGMYTREVSNNLFCVQYEYDKYGKKADQVGWLFDFGNRDRVEAEMDAKWLNTSHLYDPMDYRQKLILLTMLRQKAGNGAHTKLYQGYRELAAQPGFDPQHYPLPDLLNQYYSDYSQQDFTPVLENWGLKLNADQADRNRAQGYHPVAHLIDVVPAASLKAARELLDPNILINSNFELVQNKDIQTLGLHGNLTVNLVGNQLTELQGQELVLKDGDQVVASQTITGNQVTFSQVPNGVYAVSLVGDKTDHIFTTQKYVVIKEANNSFNLNFQVQSRSQLLNQMIDFRGYADRTAATLTTDLSTGVAHFNVVNDKPHEYIDGDYIKITVKDAQGQVIYQTTLKGQSATVGDNVFRINPGDTIEIYHRETPKRLQSSDDIIIKSGRTNVLVVTRYGLENKALSTTAKSILLQKIETLGNQLEADASHGNLTGSDRVKNLKLAIQELDAESQKTMMTKFGNLFQ